LHRRLSAAQDGWPRTTLQNPDGSPLLAATGLLRGLGDLLTDFIARFIGSCAELFEELDAWLREQHGMWWKGTSFEGWQPK
jgi:hypothetical protein